MGGDEPDDSIRCKTVLSIVFIGHPIVFTRKVSTDTHTFGTSWPKNTSHYEKIPTNYVHSVIFLGEKYTNSILKVSKQRIIK